MKVSQALQLVSELSNALASTEDQLEQARNQVQYLNEQADHIADRAKDAEQAVERYRNQVNITGDKINMIKRLRMTTGLPLKEAKIVIEYILGEKVPASTGEITEATSLGQLLKDKLGIPNQNNG